jgi:hypothetical protein
LRWRSWEYLDGFGESAIREAFDVDFGGLGQRNESSHILIVSKSDEGGKYGNSVVEESDDEAVGIFIPWTLEASIDGINDTLHRDD